MKKIIIFKILIGVAIGVIVGFINYWLILSSFPVKCKKQNIHFVTVENSKGQ
jgi:hypothetical protein